MNPQATLKANSSRTAVGDWKGEGVGGSQIWSSLLWLSILESRVWFLVHRAPASGP